MRKILLILLCLLMIAGCSPQERRHYREVEKNALSYYREKYDDRSAKIENTFKAGNDGLFGYLDVGDRAYEMSDGCYVYWDDSEAVFYDTRQAEAINQAFDEQLLMPLIDELKSHVLLSSHLLNRTGFDSFDKSVFHEYYDGDILAFLKKEKPFDDLRMFIIEHEGFQAEAWIEDFYARTDPYLSGWTMVTVLREPRDIINPDTFYPYLSDSNVSLIARFSYGEEIGWYRQKYVEVVDGIYLCSDEKNLTLEAGDIRFVAAGTGQDMQKILDDNYYAMPVHAPENENGVYQVKDQANEMRTVLKELNGTLYRVEFSERVKAALDSNDTIGVYIMTDRDLEMP